MIIKNYFA